MSATTPPHGDAVPRQFDDDHGRVVRQVHRGRAYAAGPGAARPRAAKHVVDVVAAGDARSRGDRAGRADVEVAAEHDAARRPPTPQRRRAAQREVGLRARARSAPARAGWPPTSRRARRTRVHDAPLGPPAQRRARGARRSRAPRTRIALAPPPLDLMRSGRRRASARRSGSSAVARGQRRARARAARRAPSAGGHHGGTSCSSATSHSQPASARGELASSSSRPAVGHRAAVEEVPGQDAHRLRILPALAAPPPHRRRADRRRAARAARPRRSS